MSFSNMTMGSLFGGLLFSSIGLGVFIYGKRTANFTMMGLGGALMVYTFFFSSTAMIYLVGIGLCAAVYYLRGE
jgi:hypothetical protein